MKLTADDLKKTALTLADSAEILAEFDGPSDSDCTNNGAELLARCALMLRSLATRSPQPTKPAGAVPMPMPVMEILDRREVTPLCDHVVMGYTEAQMVAYRDACVAAAGGVLAITESRVELAREAYYNAASVEDGCYTAPDAMRAALAAGGVQGISCPKWRSALRLAFGALEELAVIRVNDSRRFDALEMRKAGNAICKMLAQPIPQQPAVETAGREEALGFARPADLDGVRRNKDSDASIGVFVQPQRTETHSIPLYTTPSPEPAVEATGTVDGYSWRGQTVGIILDGAVPRWMIGDKIRVTISPTGGKSADSAATPT